MVQDWVVAMLHTEVLARVVGRMMTIVQDWVAHMLKVKLLTRGVARVVTRAQDCVAAMMNTVQCIVSAM